MGPTRDMVAEPVDAPVDEVLAALRRMLAAALPTGTSTGTDPGADSGPDSPEAPADDTPLAAYGLDSMTAARLVLEIKEELGADVPLEWLRDAGGLRDLARRIAGALPEDRLHEAEPHEAEPHKAEPHKAEPPGQPAHASPREGAAPEDRFAPFPLTPMQQAYVAGSHPDLGPDPVGCHLYREFEIAGLDPDRLKEAWGRVVAHHDMLRAVLTEDGRQRVMPEAGPWTMPVHEVAEADLDDRVAEVRGRLTRLRHEPGDWPLFAVEVTRARDGRAVVHLDVDAIVTDGRGLDLLLSDWWRAYVRPGDPLPEPPGAGPSVRECVERLRAHTRTPTHRADLDHWRRRLADLPPGPALSHASTASYASTAPAAGAGPDVPAPSGEPRRPLEGGLAEAEWRALRERATAWNVSPTALVLTVFAETLAWAGARTPFSLVLTTSDRVRLPAAADRLVGPFTSSLVFPMPALDGMDLGEAAREVHRLLWSDLDHAAVGGVEALRHLRRGAPPPLPVVFTSMLGTRAEPPGFGRDVRYAVTRTSGVGLDHQMWEQDGGLRFRWDVAEGLHPGVEAVFARFANTLRALAAEDPRADRVLPLNDLQQAYYVARRSGGEGCQVYHAFEVADLDVDRLERAWLRLAEAYEPLRMSVSVDGRLLVRSRAPRRWHIPVSGLDAEAVRATLAVRPFPLGRGPHAEIQVTRGISGSRDAGAPPAHNVSPANAFPAPAGNAGAAGTATVHVAVDLAVADARSIHLLLRELWRLYADPAADPAPAADPREHRPASSPELVAYWRERLAELPPGPALPSPAAGEERGRRRVRLEATLPGWRRLKEIAEGAGVSADAVILAAFGEALAARLPGRFALTVVRWPGWAEPCRPGEHTALSWIPHAPGDQSGSGDTPLLERARDYQRLLAADAAADGASGLAELRRVAVRRGGLAHPVVYTSVFDLDGHPLPPGVVAGEWRTCTPDVSLDCVAVGEGDRLQLCWDLDPADLPEGTAEAAFAGLRGRLAGLLGGRERPGGMSAAERHKILYEWNDTAREFPADGPVHLLFERQARERPGAVALRWRGGTMTYAELNRRANRIAWQLRDRGVGPETVVGISMRRGPDMVAAVFGVLKAGGVYLPVEPYLPRERAAVMLGDAGAALVLSTSQTTCHDVGVEVVPVDRDPVRDDPRGDENPPPVTTPDSTAYVIFTSGSTGRPKGVAVAHRPVLNLLNWAYREFGFGPEDVGLCVTSLGFDLSVFDILGLLGRGAGLYVADETEQRDPAELADVLLREPITFWNSAPTTLNQLAPLLPAHAGRPGTGDLRLVFLSGDYTPLSLPGEVRAVFPRARIVSLGGATEATVWSNYFPVGDIDPAWRSIPYGRPIDNSRYYILDEHLEPCPVGVEGDLYIAGECLSLGYYNQPELTAQRFVPDPFAPRPGELMYRTGDRASFFPDGNICFLGRADNQVKIRGFRVELGEIEHRLRQHEGVKEVVVLARPDHTGDRKLVAYVQPSGPTPPGVRDLRVFAAETLPEYMVPNFVGFVSTFPATANGKLDRDALPWPLTDAPGAAQESGAEPEEPGEAPQEEPRGPSVEELRDEIAALFAERLGVPAVRPDDDLWDQGATSFTIVQVSGELQKRYRQRVPVATLLSEPTVTAIARHVAARLSGGDGGETPEADARETDPPSRPRAAEAIPAASNGSVSNGSASNGLVSNGSVSNGSAPPDRDAGGAPAAGSVDFFSPQERAAFKAGRWGERPRLAGERIVPLDAAEFAPEHYDWRGSHREFAEAALPYDDFCRFLSLPRTSAPGERGRRLYPSAGDTYSVQAYLHVRRVEGVAAGLYYYRPGEHALQLVGPADGIDRSAHFYYNRPVYDRACFELYLVGQLDGIAPLYGDDAPRYLALEAGYMGQLLMMGQAACGVGLCPVGAVAFEQIRERLRLSDGHRFLQSFLGGVPARAVPPVAASGEPPVFGAARRDRVAAPVVPASDGRRAAEIAVVGVAGRYPGAADLAEFWRGLAEGRQAFGPMPAGRAAGGTGLTGGFLPDAEHFDSLFFHISPAEARTLDPQLRMMLRVMWECLENAGHTPGSLRRAAPRVGVFTGVMWHDHRQAGADAWRRGEPPAVTAMASDIPNRVSHFFDFRGPSVAVDTSCSSSLTALHLAVESLRRDECDAALVGGVNLVCHPYHAEVLSALGLVSPDGSAGAFDAASSGWVLGEGAGAVLLRPAAAAARDRDTAHGVVEATWIGHSGRSVRFGAPNSPALADSIRQVLRRAGRTPEEIGYVECAAAGASIADAAEIEALAEVFAGTAGDGGRGVPVGTVKPNIGHLESAAGMSQLAKVLLQFSHREIAPTLAGRTGGLVSWDALPLRLADRREPWRPHRAGEPLRALVNALGASGSYAHVVLRSAG
ncbi:amino acid adenylation domain-containing protein [Microbispora siamensis]